MITTLRINRLSLDLRGIDPATAEAAVRLLGPALQAQMNGLAGIAAVTEPQALAQRLAQRLAERVARSLVPPVLKG